MLSTILLIALILALLGVVPIWPFSRDWRYRPSSVLGLVLIAMLAIVLLRAV